MLCLNQQQWLLLLLLLLLILIVASSTRGDDAASPPVVSLGGIHHHVIVTPTPTPKFFHIAAIRRNSLHHLLVVVDVPSAESECISNYYSSVPRGGGGNWQWLQDSKKRHARALECIDDSIDNPDNIADESNTFANGRFHEYGENLPLPLPKRLLTVAKNIVGRTAKIIFFRSRWEQQIQQSPEETEDTVNVDHSFDELDSIIDNTTSLEVRHQPPHFPESDSNVDIDNNSNSNNNLPSWPTLPRGVSSMTGGWKQRTFRQWINQMENKFLSRETANALKTIRSIIEKFPEYGVVDLFGMYSPKEVIWSIVALSRLQQVLETSEPPRTRDNSANIITTDKQLLDELAHYCTFANAAYGWKGFAFCGRLHLGGDYRVLARSTGIDRRDIVTANWRSKTNRPAYYIARDVKQKTIVLAIRGSFSPRDLLTDLCASCENFIVEDELEIGEIGYYRNFTTPRLVFGRAHKGMVDAARAISAMTGKIVTDELEKYPDYSLMIVGHSLGGGVAAIIAAMWHRRFRNRVRSIGYGNPCVFPLNLTKAFDNIITVEVSGDPFATISLGHLADSTKAISKLCQDKGMREEILKRLDDLQNISRADIEWCANAMLFLRRQMDSEKLYPPGMIYQLSGPMLDFQALSDEKKSSNGQGDGVLAVLASTDANVYSELKLHARMFDVSLHIPMRYEMLLRRLSSTAK